MAGPAGSMDVAVQPDGKIVAAGSSYSSNQFVFALARYKPYGSLDSSFGSHGTATAAFGQDIAYAESLALQADGKIVVAGDVAPQNSDLYSFTLARFNADGSDFGGPAARKAPVRRPLLECSVAALTARSGRRSRREPAKQRAGRPRPLLPRPPGR